MYVVVIYFTKMLQLIIYLYISINTQQSCIRPAENYPQNSSISKLGVTTNSEGDANIICVSVS